MRKKSVTEKKRKEMGKIKKNKQKKERKKESKKLKKWEKRVWWKKRKGIEEKRKMKERKKIWRKNGKKKKQANKQWKNIVYTNINILVNWFLKMCKKIFIKCSVLLLSKANLKSKILKYQMLPITLSSMYNWLHGQMSRVFANGSGD